MRALEDLISIKNLRTTFETKLGPIHAVDDISYSIKKSKTLGIVGESGCGKSVTSLSLMGLIDPPGRVSQGVAQFQGTDLLKLSESELQQIRGRKIAMIFQEPMTALNPVLTIGHQIDEQIIRHLKVSKAEAKEKSIEMLNRVGIPSPAQRYAAYPHQLSGGMRQRAMIAMALSCDPEFLIADEPTTALDVTIQAQILELIQNLQEQMGMAVQFITHDLGVISQMADDIMVMYAGQVCEIGSAKEVFNHPRHPYTKALIRSIPKLGSTHQKLPTIEGQVPSLLNKPTGCPFRNRCKNAVSECAIQRPPLVDLACGHKVACYNMED